MPTKNKLKNLDSVKESEQTEQSEPVKLPASYVLWLTWRSKFLDALCINDETLYERWKEFEAKEVDSYNKIMLEL